MNAPFAKFTFDLDMSDGLNKNASNNKLDKQIEQAREQAYNEGFRDGEASEQSRHNQALEQAVIKLIDKALIIAAEREQTHKQLMGQAIKLAKYIAVKLSVNLINKQPETELNALLTECLSSLDNVPHLVIHCHPELAQICEQKAKEQIKASRFSGNLVIMADEEIALGDGKIEWVDGGLVRDSSQILQQIDSAIENYISAHNLPENNEIEEEKMKTAPKAETA